MIRSIKRVLPALMVLTAVSASAQFYKFHGGNISVGATGNFVSPLANSPQPVTYNTVTPSGITLTNTIVNQNQYITSSVGFLTSFQFHPLPWAGVELNYGYQHYSERVNYNVVGNPNNFTAGIPTTTHEATGAYQFHPKKIPFQPFVNVGGGAIDFVPTAGNGSSQWRGAGLLETGVDVPMPGKQLALRIMGRGLFYRTPNFGNSALGSHEWRVSAEPSASFVYRF
jgi:hypothetical protein